MAIQLIMTLENQLHMVPVGWITVAPLLCLSTWHSLCF